MIQFLDSPNLKIVDGRPTTTSLDIARNFGKEHSKVLKSIRNLECSQRFSQANFGLAKYSDEQGKPRPMYRITRDGWSILVMGFTGSKAMAWKEKYIAAFNAMEAELLRIRHRPPTAKVADWKAIANWMEKAGNKTSGTFAQLLANNGFSISGEIPVLFRAIPLSLIERFILLARKGNEWAKNLIQRTQRIAILSLPEAT